MINQFDYTQLGLSAEQVPLAKIARDIGTPFYCYSTAALRQAFFSFDKAFSNIDRLICFAVKSNFNPAVLRVLARHGMGADVVSSGELRLALRAKIRPEKIVFSGVGKSPTELAQALKVGIFQINVESVAELNVLNQVASDVGKVADIALRVNPNVDAKTHEKITTGKAENKFGIAWEEVLQTYQHAANLPHINPVGVAVHIGSQITTLEPFELAFTKVVELVKTLRSHQIQIKRLDLGGGIGIRYIAENPTAIEDYAAMVQRLTKDLGCKIMFEPGRYIAGNAGVLVTKVLYVKESAGQKFAIVDAGMNDLMRPAMYDAKHAISPLTKAVATETYNVVGPVCESSDVFARSISLPPLNPGDLLAIHSAGAYGSVMGNNYNMRLSIPEVLVDGERLALTKRRENLKILIDSISCRLG